MGDSARVEPGEVGGTVSSNFDFSFPSSCPPLLASGEVDKGEVYNEVINKMTNMSRLACLLEVDGRISNKTRVPVVFHKGQVCLETTQSKCVQYGINEDNVIIYMISDIIYLISGTMVVDKVSVSSIFNDSRSFTACQMQVYLRCPSLL